MSKKILFADDSPPLRKIIKTVLEKEGYLVDEAGDGAEAVEKMKQEKDYQLFLIDISMPILDGFAVIKEIRATDHYNKTPVVIVTTEDMIQRKVEGYQIGADGWVVKPFDPDELVKVVNKLANK